jgi:hypothetical protein
LVEQLTLNQRVEGSSPPAPTINSTAYRTGRRRLPTFLSRVFQLGFVFSSARDAFSVSRMRGRAADESKQPTVSGCSVDCGTYRVALRHQLSRRGPLRRVLMATTTPAMTDRKEMVAKLDFYAIDGGLVMDGKSTCTSIRISVPRRLVLAARQRLRPRPLWGSLKTKPS